MYCFLYLVIFIQCCGMISSFSTNGEGTVTMRLLLPASPSQAAHQLKVEFAINCTPCQGHFYICSRERLFVYFTTYNPL